MNRYIDYGKSAELLTFINENSYGCTANILTEDSSGEIDAANAVISRMLVSTVGKYKKLDLGEIERSRGDVYKCKFTRNLDEAIKTLIDISEVTEKISDISVISVAFENLKSMKKSFENAFRLKNNIAMMTYNMIFYAIMEATSYYIAAAISLAKDGENVKVDVYNVSGKDCVLIAALNNFNKSVLNGDIYKFIDNADQAMNEAAMDDYVITEGIGDDLISGIPSFIKEPLKTFFTSDNKNIKLARRVITGVGAAATIVYIASKIVPTLRIIIYWYYKCKHKISESAALQAEFLSINISQLKASGATDKRTLYVIEKQQDKVDRFNKIAEKYSLDNDKTERDMKNELKNDKIDISDIVI